MKPIIIFAQKDNNGNICMSAEEFEKYIQKAYEAGVEDGESKSHWMNADGITGGTITVPYWNEMYQANVLDCQYISPTSKAVDTK